MDGIGTAPAEDEMGDDSIERMEEDPPAGVADPSDATAQDGGASTTQDQSDAPWDSLADAQTRAANTIVIQPGSSILRIGRASNPAPCLVPHVVARLCTGAAAEEAAERKLPETEKEVADRQREVAELERSLKRLSGPTARASGRGPGEGGGVEEEVVESQEAFEFLGLATDGAPQQTFVGADALRVSCALRPDGSRYVVRHPMHRGRLVLRASAQEQMCDLVTVWEHALRDVLGVPLADLAGMACVLVLPANICKYDAKFMVDAAVLELRFRTVFVVQDAACTCFQVNAPTACVIDIGAGKTSVTAVEDGLCMPSSTFHLGYGAEDMGRLYLSLLQRGGRAGRGGAGDQAALALLDEGEPVHREAFRAFREATLQILAPQQDVPGKSGDLVLHFPQRAGKASLHRVRVGSAAFVAPMGLFYPEKLFAPLDWAAAERKSVYEPGDVMDDDYIVDMLANRPGGTGQVQADDKLLLRDDQQLPPGGAPPGALPDVVRDAIARVIALHEANRQAEGGGAEGRKENKAVEAAQRLWGNIILTGGGAEIKGLLEALEMRLTKLKHIDADRVRISTRAPNAVEGDHEHLAWSGGCLLPSVESYKELSIRREEWEQRGIMVLREKAFFPW